MAEQFTWLTDVVWNMVGSVFFWVFLIIGIFIAIIIGLWWKRKKRFKIPVVIFTEIGNGKFAMNEDKAGWFAKDKIFFGLWEKGSDEELMTKQGEVIYGSTPEDYHEFNFIRTLFVTPSLDDPRILFPISKAHLSNDAKQLLMDLPSLEIREAAVDAFKKTAKEMKDMREQIVQWILVGLFFIVAFLVILFITQYGKHMVDKASDVLTQVGNQLIEIKRTQQGVPA